MKKPNIMMSEVLKEYEKLALEASSNLGDFYSSMELKELWGVHGEKVRMALHHFDNLGRLECKNVTRRGLGGRNVNCVVYRILPEKRNKKK